MKNLVLFFLLAQGGANVLRIGSVGRTLTSQDIEGVIRVLPPGDKPWLINAEPSQISFIQAVEVYVEPARATENLRRGSVVTVSRQAAPAGQAWNARSTEEYAQVVIPGRSFTEITSDQDLNRPFRVTGKFEDAELIRLVNSLRSLGVQPAGTANDQLFTRNVQLLPILSVWRRDSLTVHVDLRIESMKGQTVMLEKRGEDWAVVSVRNWIA